MQNLKCMCVKKSLQRRHKYIWENLWRVVIWKLYNKLTYMYKCSIYICMCMWGCKQIEKVIMGWIPRAVVATDCKDFKLNKFTGSWSIFSLYDETIRIFKGFPLGTNSCLYFVSWYFFLFMVNISHYFQHSLNTFSL